MSFQTLFNPNKTVVKMFVVVYDMSNMPADCQTFLRQRTLYMPIEGSASDIPGAPIFLRYLIHLRLVGDVCFGVNANGYNKRYTYFSCCDLKT